MGNILQCKSLLDIDKGNKSIDKFFDNHIENKTLPTKEQLKEWSKQWTNEVVLPKKK